MEIVPLVLAAGLPAAGLVVFFLLVHSSFRQAVEGSDDPGIRARLFPKLAIFVMQSFTSVVFGFVVWSISSIWEVDIDRAAHACLTIGATGLCTVIAQSLLARGAMKGIARDERSFGKEMISMAQAEPTVIFGFVVSFLMMMPPTTGTGYRTGALVMALLSLGAPAAAPFVARIPVAEFPRRIIFGTAMMAGPLFGFLLAFLLI